MSNQRVPIINLVVSTRLVARETTQPPSHDGIQLQLLPQTDMPLLDVVAHRVPPPRGPLPEAGDEHVTPEGPDGELGQTHEGEDDEDGRPPGAVCAPGVAEAMSNGVGTRRRRGVDAIEERDPREPAQRCDEEAGQDGGRLVVRLEDTFFFPASAVSNTS
ncbi:hypothetical protein XA68_12695 [Ophiocordyceps unilateralis]|uniref:Uncharacterized protein n=1 Tax=Ophiocordyceps unilateralis TaxID=268505 RepID=A0A2A9NV80_OPHUN|nr:hypothetical protein XA68_12695 [Ophiocordyceps unilateralis]